MLFKTSSLGTFNSISQSDQTVYKTNSYGGSGGGDFSYSFGNYISKLTTYTYIPSSSSQILYGIKFLFDDGTEALAGSCSDPNLQINTLDLTSDSISKMYILIVYNKEIFSGDPNGEGCGGIYIETIKGLSFTSVLGKTPQNSSGWQLVLSPSLDMVNNFFLVGASGKGGATIDALSFYFQKDLLVSRVVENFDYSFLPPSTTPTPINVATQIVDNKTSETQEASITFTESVSSTFTWSAETGITVGAEMTINTGIPFVAEGEVTTSLEVSFAYTWGEEKSVTREFSYQANVSVPSNSTIIASATASSYQLSGSYTADFIENWLHAGAKTKQIKGNIKGLSAYNVEINYDTKTPQPGSPLHFTLI